MTSLIDQLAAKVAEVRKADMPSPAKDQLQATIPTKDRMFAHKTQPQKTFRIDEDRKSYAKLSPLDYRGKYAGLVPLFAGLGKTAFLPKAWKWYHGAGAGMVAAGATGHDPLAGGLAGAGLAHLARKGKALSRLNRRRVAAGQEPHQIGLVNVKQQVTATGGAGGSAMARGGAGGSATGGAASVATPASTAGSTVTQVAKKKKKDPLAGIMSETPIPIAGK